MDEARRPVPRHVRLWAVLAVSLLVVAAVMNLILVAEAAPDVDPRTREGTTWQNSAGTPSSGQQTWTFTVDPAGRRIVELAASIPYSVRLTHVSGEATLAHRASFWVDGEELAHRETRVSAQSTGNETARVGRVSTAPGTFEAELRVARAANATPFILLVVWDWTLEASPGAEATYQTTIRELTVAPVDLPGLPGCRSPACAQALVLVAVGAQLGAFAWFRAAPPRAPRQDARSGDHAR